MMLDVLEAYMAGEQKKVENFFRALLSSSGYKGSKLIIVPHYCLREDVGATLIGGGLNIGETSFHYPGGNVNKEKPATTWGLNSEVSKSEWFFGTVKFVHAMTGIGHGGLAPNFLGYTQQVSLAVLRNPTQLDTVLVDTISDVKNLGVSGYTYSKLIQLEDVFFSGFKLESLCEFMTDPELPGGAGGHLYYSFTGLKISIR